MTKTPSARTAWAFIGLLSALLVAMSPQSAIALDYCRRDSSSDMWNCSYATMKQCDQAASGRGGYCRHDPFLPAPATAHLHHAAARPPSEANARMTRTTDDFDRPRCDLAAHVGSFATAPWDWHPPCQAATGR